MNIKEKILDLRLKNKLIISYLIIIIVPIVVLGFSSYYYFSVALTDKVISSTQKNNKQVLKNIDSLLVSLSKFSEFPNLDSELNSILKKDYSKVDRNRIEIEIYRDKDKAESSLYRSISYINDFVDSVIVLPNNSNSFFSKYKSNYFNSHYTVEQMKEWPWYKKIVLSDGREVLIGIHQDDLFSKGKQYIFSVGRNIINISNNSSLGVILINTRVSDLEKLWKDAAVTQNSKFIVLDENDLVLYSKGFDNILGTDIKDIHSLGAIDFSLKIQEKIIDRVKYNINISVSDYSKWKVISLIPSRELLAELDNIRIITIILCWILVIIAVIVSAAIATSITNPIIKLKKTMKSVEEGNLDIKVEKLPGEIGELGNSFNKMLLEMKLLIDRIYENEQEKSQAEFEALQAQINPHFLYNTLNVIKWMANIQGSKGIVNALTSLVEMLTFAAKVKSEKILIKQELKQIEHYINILNIRYFGKFEVSFDIDEDVYEYCTLKFLLQPIIENSIFHGFEDMKSVGLINISIKKVGSLIVYDVTDNGKGIEEELIIRIIDGDIASESAKKFNKIGIYNVNKRIKLIFGEDYGITIYSEIGRFTRVHVEIPAISEREGN